MMRTWCRIYANFDEESKKELLKFGIFIEPSDNYFRIFDDSPHFKEILNISKNCEQYRLCKATTFFSNEEIDNSNSFLLRWVPAEVSDPVGESSEEMKEFIYGNICKNCSLPLSYKPNENPIHFKREPILRRKSIAFSTIGINNIWFTSKDKFDIFFKKWGFDKKPIVFGKKKIVSTELIQLIAPFAPSALKLKGTEYGQTFDLERKNGKIGNYPPCKTCGQNKYTNQSIDFFPRFENEHDFDFTYSQEWFEWYHHIIVSKRFLDHLVDLKAIRSKYDTNYIIPVEKDY